MTSRCSCAQQQCVLADVLEGREVLPVPDRKACDTLPKQDCYPILKSLETWQELGLLMDEVLSGIRFQNREFSSMLNIYPGK